MSKDSSFESFEISCSFTRVREERESIVLISQRPVKDETLGNDLSSSVDVDGAIRGGTNGRNRNL